MEDDSSPPRYTAASPEPQVLVNLAPPAHNTSFQVGYLGHGPAFIAGEVQVKFAGTRPDDQPRPAFARFEVCFKGVETSADLRDDPIDLFEQRQVLWGQGAAGTSSSPVNATSSDARFPPGSTPFKLELTPDLPVCIHAPASSSLSYTLTATLYPTDPDALPLVQCAPVHLVRTSPPGSLPVGAPASTPRTVSATSPLAFSVRLPRTAFRRSEPIELTTRVEVPDAKAVGEGLRLRTISAELVRSIAGVGVSRSGAATADGRDQDLPGILDEAHQSAPHVHRTVLAHSGKSARFSPSRPIIIRLVLHPPVDPSCESITQSTILHTVSFAVVVTVGLVSARPSSSTGRAASPLPDAVLSQEVVILPDGPPPARSDKQAEVDREHYGASAVSFSPPPPEAWSPVDAPVPTYVERSEYDSGQPSLTPVAGSSSVWSPFTHTLDVPAPLVPGASASPLGFGADEDTPYASVYPTDGDEEEYDGYEELSLSATLSTRPPPPAIDEDVSPPSAGEPSSVSGFALAAAMGGLIDEREEDELRAPPTDDLADESPAPPEPYDAPPPALRSPPPALQMLVVPSDERATALIDSEAPPPATPPSFALGQGQSAVLGSDDPSGLTSPPPPQLDASRHVKTLRTEVGGNERARLPPDGLASPRGTIGQEDGEGGGGFAYARGLPPPPYFGSPPPAPPSLPPRTDHQGVVPISGHGHEAAPASVASFSAASVLTNVTPLLASVPGPETRRIATAQQGGQDGRGSAAAGRSRSGGPTGRERRLGPAAAATEESQMGEQQGEQQQEVDEGESASLDRDEGGDAESRPPPYE